MIRKADPPLAPKDERMLVSEFARTVARAAHLETTEAFEEAATDYVDGALPVPGRRRARDQRGGFGGLPGTVPLVVWTLPILAPALRYLACVVFEAIQVEARPHLVAILRRLVGSAGRDRDAIRLSAPQIAEVGRIVRENALALDRSEEEATVLANAVEGCLAVGG